MELKQRFFSTYSKVILSQYGPIKTIIVAHSRKSADQEEPEGQDLLSAEQINEALNGPFGQFIQLIISAYSTINRLVSALNLVQDTLFKTKRINILDEIKLPAHLKNYPLAKITALEKNFNQQLTKYHQTLENQLQTWLGKLLQAITDITFPLSEIEQRELSAVETISSLLNQFIDFKIEPPITHLDPITFCDYLILKAHLAIHNSLGRRQQPSTATDIMPIMKKLKPTFEAIAKEEKKIKKAQADTIQALIKPIQF